MNSYTSNLTFNDVVCQQSNNTPTVLDVMIFQDLFLIEA